MHNKSAIIVMMAAVMVMVISGCGKRDTAWVDPPVMKIAGGSQTGSTALLNTKSELQKTRDALRLPGASRERYGIPALGGFGSGLESRFMKAFDEWREYRSELPDQISVERPVPKARSSRSGEPAKPFVPGVTYVPEYPSPTDILSWRLRVALLENRLKSAGEIDKKAIGERLDLAKASLSEAERIYGQMKPVPPATPVAAVRGHDGLGTRANTVIVVARPDSRDIKNAMAALMNSGAQRTYNGDLSADYMRLDDYRSLETTTIAGIDKALVELGKRQLSGSGMKQ